jgi:hypothetical protein
MKKFFTKVKEFLFQPSSFEQDVDEMMKSILKEHWEKQQLEKKQSYYNNLTLDILLDKISEKGIESLDQTELSILNDLSNGSNI